MNLIIINVATFTIQLRIKGETIIYILQNFANLLRQRNVLRDKNVKEHTIGLRDSITKISTRRNSATSIQTKHKLVTTENTALLLIRSKISRLD